MASFNYNLVVLEVEVIFHAISKIIKLSLLSIRIILLFRGGAQLVCDSQCKMLVSLFFGGGRRRQRSSELLSYSVHDYKARETLDRKIMS